MDALAQAYGSDSSDSSGSQGKGTKGGILAAYEDSDTDSENERVETQSSSTQEKHNPNDILNTTDKICVHSSKKKRIDASSMDKEDASTTNILPNPLLLETSSTSQYLFPKNYLHGKKHYQDMNVKLNSTLVKLQQDSGSFAQHLKQQKEFGNKSIFPGIIEHFKIDPMGSNIDKNIFESFEYIERLLAKEEENRLRMTEE